MLVWHFSRLIRLIATFSFFGAQKAAWTTAVAPLPGGKRESYQHLKDFSTKGERQDNKILSAR